MARAKKEKKEKAPAASPESPVSDRDLVASPETECGAGAAEPAESDDGGSDPNHEPIPGETWPPIPDPPPAPRMSGEELKAKLRQDRREARLKEKGY